MLCRHKMRRDLLAMAALSYVVVRTARAQVPDTPAQIVANLYRRCVVNGQWKSLLFDKAGRRSVLARGLWQAMDKADGQTVPGDTGWLDFDPVSNSEDPGVYDPRFTVLAQGANTASVRASFRYAADPRSQKLEVRYELVHEDGSWKIADIHGRSAAGDPEWSLREMLHLR